jgi:hypothetical protein
MTDGPERARLRTYLTGAKDEASDLAGDNWRYCGNILKETAFALRLGATKIRDGEGDGQEGGLSGMMADTLLAAFEASSASMEDKGTRLIGGGDALKDTARVIANAKTAEAGMADLQQPPAYTAPTPVPGVPFTPEEIKAEATKRQAANQEMAAYNAARAQQEAAAAEWTQKLDAVFLESIPPMKAIHGQPDPTEPPPSVPSSPSSPSLPVTPSTPGTPDPTDPGRPDRGETGVRTDGVVRGEPVWEEDPERPEKPERPERPEKPVDPIEPQPPRNPITTPTHPTDPTDAPGPTTTVGGSSQSGVTYNPAAGQAPGAMTAGGSTGGMNAAALGAAGAAGGASGMAGGIRAGSAPAPTGSSPARPIGATGRSASAGALSRPAGATGSAASRAGAAGSPAARGASAGSSAAARGAGSASARGAGAAGARGAGSAGGRAAGSAGGRGAAQSSGSGGRGSSGARGAGSGGAAGRGGRKGERDRATDRDSLVYEQDWLGDDDVAPGVLD